MIRRWSAFVALFAVLAWAASARADAAGDAALKKVDEAVSRYKTLELRYDLVTVEPGKADTLMKVHTRMKGSKQLTELLAPADIKGTKVLIVTPTQMYVYLPAYRKVRRIASHLAEQPFMGTAFNANDMNLQRYGDRYGAAIQGDTGAEVVLDLSAKPDAEGIAYPKIELKVDKKTMLPTDIKYFAAGGKHVKTETRRDYVCQREICQAKKTRMTNHAQGGLYSELTLTDHKIDPPFDDDLFSKRSLQR
jgi:outer membrane lipoprotein-sorting protein